MSILIRETKLLYFTGEAIATIDCLDSGNPGKSTNLTCKITGTIVSGIRWLRPNGGTLQEVMVCDIWNTECDPAVGITGYVGVVDSPTQDTLIIDSYSVAVDEGEWICRDGPSGTGQSSCKKTTTCKLHL